MFAGHLSCSFSALPSLSAFRHQTSKLPDHGSKTSIKDNGKLHFRFSKCMKSAKSLFGKNNKVEETAQGKSTAVAHPHAGSSAPSSSSEITATGKVHGSARADYLIVGQVALCPTGVAAALVAPESVCDLPSPKLLF